MLVVLQLLSTPKKLQLIFTFVFNTLIHQSINPFGGYFFYAIMKNIKNSRLLQLCQDNRYLLIRITPMSPLIGINCKLVILKSLRKHINLDQDSGVFSFRHCDFSEYLTYKLPEAPARAMIRLQTVT
jgi:hypothetical protein